MSLVEFKVTKNKIFSEKVVDIDAVDLRRVNNQYKGILQVDVEGIGWVSFQGDHAGHDFENDYGFILV